MNSHYADDSLKLLKDELGLTLRRAQLAMESYLEDPTEVTTLHSVVTYLDQVRGVLMMLDRPEPACLMEEMDRLIKTLIQGEVSNPAFAQELLLRLMLQAPLYWQDLQPGVQPRKFDFLCLINELRIARGVEPLVAVAPNSQSTAGNSLGSANQWRSQLQRALLGVLRRQEVRDNLERIVAIFNQLKQSALDESVYRFWWLAEALVLELLGGGIQMGREVNLVLRDLDHQIKRILENKDTSLAGVAEQELIQRMVGHLSNSERGLERLEKRLDYHPPQIDSATSIEQGGLSELIPPDTDTLQQIAAFLHEPLAVVRDSLDRFAEGKQRPAVRLYADLEALQQVANVLILLNMDLPATLIRQRLEALRQIDAADGHLSDGELTQLASELILLEGSLDGLVRFAYSQELAASVAGESAAETGDQARSGTELLMDFKVQQSRAAVAKNIIETMALARDLATAHIHNVDESAAWDDLRPILHTIKGALVLLNCERAQALTSRLEDMVRAVISGKLMTGNAVFMNAFAEIIVALEYYLKGLEDGRTPDEDILDHADNQLVLLEELATFSEPQAVIAEPDKTYIQEIASVNESESVPFSHLQLEVEAKEFENPPVLSVGPEQGLPSSLKTDFAEIDPEFLEIFIQEARDELVSIGQQLGIWRNNLADKASPQSLRRSFHTLKGSGRMVGETAIAESARRFENLLDRVIDGRLATSLQFLDVLDEVRSLLGRLIDQSPIDERQAQELATLAARAEILGNEVSAAIETPIQPDQPVEHLAAETVTNVTDSVSASTASLTDLDKELVQVFVQEATELLDASELLLQRWGVDTKNTEPLNALRRELHTLKGSSRMAGFMAIGDLAHAMESLLDAVTADKGVVSREVIEGLQRALDRLQDLLIQIRSGGGEIIAVEDLIDEFRSLLQSKIISADLPEATSIGTLVHTELDQDLVRAFLEEATELLDASELLLQHWGVDTKNTEPLNALRRELHTLKGSSRMAGFMAIGDLAHAMESLLDVVTADKAVVSSEVVEGLQRALDRLQEMIIQGRRAERVAPADEIVGYLKSLGRREAKPGKPMSQMAVTQKDSESVTKTTKVAGTDTIRVGSNLLDNLVNQMGESSIYRTRIEQKVDTFGFNLTELNQIASRLRQQLRRLEIETESQILFRYERSGEDVYEGFDPLELDRFSELQQLSRSLMEAVDDLSNIQEGLEDQIHEIGFLVDQQAKVNKEIQQGLMRTRMVRFDSVIPRLRRIVRQACQELGKQANLLLEGSESEVERAVLENIIAPLEHLLRNAVAHGIEMPARRRAAGKAETGTITLAMGREGSELVVRVTDNGGGLNYEAIRAKGEVTGLLKPGQSVSEQDLIALLLRPGFSTATELTQVSGRGVGLDVLNDAVKAMRGVLQIQSQRGQGTSFIIRLPFSLTVTKALLVRVGDHTFAVPALGVEAVTRLKDDQWQAYLTGEAIEHQYGDRRYWVHSMALLLADSVPQGITDPRPPALLFHSAEASAALQVDAVLGSQEIVVKPVAPQLLSVPGVSGATVLGDGRVVVVLELANLMRNLHFSQGTEQAQVRLLHETPQEVQPASSSVLVVDDSITMRKITARLLERHQINAATAKDGVDAVALLEEHIPDLVILDIEMPRMDGYELIDHIRSHPHLKHLPIIVVTSRSGQKHRERAISLGINGYLSKPYQEEQLLESVNKALRKHRDKEVGFLA